MRELTALLGIAGVVGYLAVGADLLRSIGEPDSGLQWDEPPTPFRRAIVVAMWPVVLLHMRRG